MAIVALGRRERTTAAQMKLMPHHCQSAAQRAGVRERAEVTRAIVLLETRERKARDWIVQIHLEHQVTLVVAETDIVARMKFLDQLALKQQRFRFTADDMKIKIANRIHQRAEFQIPTELARRMKILADSLAQVARLADINHRSEAILVQVNARLMRQRSEFFTNEFGHRQKRISTQSREGAKENVVDFKRVGDCVFVGFCYTSNYLQY